MIGLCQEKTRFSRRALRRSAQILSLQNSQPRSVPSRRGLLPFAEPDKLALCWVHDGRHYQSLTPCVPQHREWLEAFRQRYWEFYKQLRAYQEAPTPERPAQLREQFDELFSTVTGYDALDPRIAKIKADKTYLLMVLEHPEIPLHNNPAELDARLRV